MSEQLSELADYLHSRLNAIMDRWMQACQQDDALGAVNRLTREEFRNNAPAAIEGLCRALRAGSDEAYSASIKNEIAKHGHHRWRQGFSLNELIRDWGRLNQVLVGMIDEFFQEHERVNAVDTSTALHRLAVFMAEAISSSVQRFDSLRQAEAAALAKDIQYAKERFENLTRARGEMLREAAHDLRGGLSAIAGVSAVLKLSQVSNETLAEVLDALDQSVESVTNMLNPLLDLSRLESGADTVRLQSVNIAELLEQVAGEHRPVALGKGLTLETDGPAELVVQTDPEKVHRIAQNLLVNALEHTVSGTLRLAWKPDTNRWLVVVSDTGPGIQDVAGSPIAQELTASDSGYQDSDPGEAAGGYSGEGIGLTIVKRLCDLLEAGVSLESKLDQGTTFTVEFPLAYDEQ